MAKYFERDKQNPQLQPPTIQTTSSKFTLSLACRLGSAPRLARLLRTGALIIDVKCFYQCIF